MTVCGFYEQIGADYQNILTRLNNDVLIKKYLLKLSSDGSYDRLIDQIDSKNYLEAFKEAHTLKGICMNLELTPLTTLVIELTELLRNFDEKKLPTILSLLKEFSTQYLIIIDLINQL